MRKRWPHFARELVHTEDGTAKGACDNVEPRHLTTAIRALRPYA
jgi:hypothetical protein